MFMTALPASIGLRTGLAELNLGRSQMQDLPSDDLLRVVAELFDPEDFEDKKLAVEPALEAFNKLLKRSGLVAYLDAAGRCCLRNTGTGINSSILPQQPRPLSQEELAQRQKLAAYLDTASEDEFTERLLVPLFQRLGFHRVSPAGHKEKVLEFGKDLWMKYQLPTGHWIYFSAQVKRNKIDSSSGTKGNVATVLSQTHKGAKRALTARSSPVSRADVALENRQITPIRRTGSLEAALRTLRRPRRTGRTGPQQTRRRRARRVPDSALVKRVAAGGRQLVRGNPQPWCPCAVLASTHAHAGSVG